MVQPAAAPLREFDAAAEKELKEAFGIFRETRDAAREKYADVRWKIVGSIGDSAGTAVVVRPQGRDQLLIQFKSQGEVDQLIRGNVYTIEATVDDMLSRHFVEGVVLKTSSESNGRATGGSAAALAGAAPRSACLKNCCPRLRRGRAST
jgi:hypothetical protein